MMKRGSTNAAVSAKAKPAASKTPSKSSKETVTKEEVVKKSTPTPPAAKAAKQEKPTAAVIEKKPTATKRVAETVAAKQSKVAKEAVPGKADKVATTTGEEKKSKKRPMSSEDAKVTIPDLSKKPDASVLKLASTALLQHVVAHESSKKQKVALLPGVSKEASAIFLQIGLRNMPEQALKTFKGRPIELPHPFRDLETCSICMFVKDKVEAKKWLGDDYEKHGIKKMISLQQLRTNYKSFQDRRELADLYDAFVADDRIVCMLPKTLGKAFYSGPKRPLPIRLAKNEKLAGSVTTKIQKALKSAFFYLPGVSTSIRVGTTDMTAEQLVANVQAVINGAVEHVPGSWKGVQSIFLKSEKSAALPLYEAAAPMEKE